MLSSSINLADKYDYLADKFRIGYSFLRRSDLQELPLGVLELEQGIKVILQEYETISAEQCKFETHEKFFDIQYIVSGREFFAIIPREELVVETGYDTENDITFYEEPKTYGKLILNAGDFVIVSPEEAHKSRMSIDKVCFVRKAIVKIPV